MILAKRLPRELFKNKFRYLSVFILIVIGYGIIFGGIIGNDSILHTVEKYQGISNVEDGEFTTLTLLADDALYLLDSLAVGVEETFYTDIGLENDTTLRIFRVRNSINTIVLDEGHLPEDDKSVVIEKHYARENQIEVGHSLSINETDYKVTGIGSVPDYNLIVANPTDLAADPGGFSVAFISDEAFAKLRAEEKYAFVFNYTYVNSGNLSDSEIKNTLSEETALAGCLTRNTNNRIEEYEGEVKITNNATLIFGLVFSVLMAYVLVIFVSANIEKESDIIGTLYSMGYKKHELIRHYLILPVLVVIIGTITGLLAGITIGIPLLTDDTISYYSLPVLEVHYSPAYIAYSLLVPPVTTAVVCYISISKRLSAAPLALLRKTPAATNIRNTEVPAKNAIGILRFRQFAREFRANLIMLFGLFVSVFLLVMSVSIWGSLENYARGADESVPYQYQYSMVSSVPAVPEKATAAILKRMSIYSGQTDQYLDVIVLGLPVENAYYSLTNISADEEVYISDSLADKLHISSDSQLVLADELENRQYSLQAVAEHEASSGLYVFMDIEAMREMMGYEEGYYNTLLSSELLEIDSAYVLSITTTNDIKRAAENMLEQMEMMIGVLISGAVIIFTVVIYLLLKSMIDRSAYSISLLKILGYQKREINKIYLGNSFYMVLLSALTAVPMGRVMMEGIFPYFVQHLSVSIKVYVYPYMYVMVFMIVFLCYFIISMLLKHQLNKISLAVILKDQE